MLASGVGHRLTAVLTAVIVLSALTLRHAAASEPAERAWLKAIAARDAQALSRLLDREPALDVNVTPEEGISALMVAAKAGRVGLVRGLLERGARVRARSRAGGSALMFAAQGGDTGTVSRLLEAGAELDETAGNGWSALTVAAAIGDAGMTRYLLERGAAADVRDIYGWTPLMRAADNGHPRAVETLIEHGHSDIGLRNDRGMTALHHAAYRGHTAIIRILLDHGAPTGVRDAAGRTPLALARLASQAGAAALLSAGGGRGTGR